MGNAIEKTVSSEYTDRMATALKQTSRGVVEMARIAAEARDEYGHGAYLKWATGTVGISESFANKLLSVHKKLLSSVKFTQDVIESIAPSALYLLAAPSTPEKVVNSSIKKTAAGKHVTHADVKNAIKKTKEPEPVKVVVNRSKPSPRITSEGAQSAPPDDGDERFINNEAGENQDEEQQFSDEPIEFSVPTNGHAIKAQVIGRATRLKATEEEKPGWLLVANATEEIISDLRAVAGKMRKAFGIEAQEITNPDAKRFTRLGTVGAVLELIRNLETDKPIGRDAKGIITAGDDEKRKAFAAGRKAS